MNDEVDGRPSSTGSVELSNARIEEIGYLSENSTMFDKMLNGNLTNGFPGGNNGDQVYMEIAEQPQARGFRFRYPSEGSSHGGLQGELSARHKKSYPAVRIRNFNGPCRIMVSLVTDEQVPRAHAHELVGKNCKNGICVVEMKGNNEMIATFPNLGIQHVTKKKVVQILTERILESVNVHRAVQTKNFGHCTSMVTDEDKLSAKKQATDQSKNIKLNVVRLMFQGYLQDAQGGFTRMINPVLTRPIYDSKSPGAAALKICRMDKHAGCCSGSEEVFLLCDKVQKDDIHVRFFEEDEDGAVRWEGFGDFGPADVHRQYAIVFKTPRYCNLGIMKPVTVRVQLKRMSDNETSDPKPFTYYPMQLDKEEVGKKRRKMMPFGDGDGTGYFGGGNLGGMPPSMGGGGNAGGMFGAPGFQGFMGGPGIGGYQQAMGLGLGESSDDSDDDESRGRRGRPAHHTFAPASGPVGGRARACRKLASASAAMQDSSSDSDSSSLEESDTSSASEDFVDSTVPEPLSVAAAAQDPDPQKVSHPLSATAVSELTVKSPSSEKVDQITAEISKLKVDGESKKDKKKKHRHRHKQKAMQAQPLSPAQLVWLVAERTNAGLQNYAATGDVRHMLLIQRHLVSVEDLNGDTALHVAIINRQIQVVQNLLNTIATLPNCEAVNKPNYLQQTPLHLAVLTGQPHVVDLLLERNAIVPAVDRHGDTPIHIAASKGDSQCLGNILKRLRGPKPGPCPLNYQGYTPLILAVIGGHLSCVKMLVAAGAHVGQPDGKSGRTPLHHAVEADNVAIAGYLLLEGEADPNIPTFDGNTALHLAVGRNQVGLAALLITAGADPDAENLDPTFEADDAPRAEPVLGEEKLLPVIQEHESSGTTPLDLAVGNEKMLKVLRGEPYSSVSPTSNVVLPPAFPTTSLTTESLDDTCGLSLSSMTTGSVTSINAAQLFSQRGDLHKLDALGRTNLAKLLDPVSPGKDWSGLAERLAMSALIQPLNTLPSPTKALLDNFEAIEGNMKQLLDALESMERGDAVQVVREALKYHRDQNRIAMSLMKDEGEDKERVESGIGSMPEGQLDSSLH